MAISIHDGAGISLDLTMMDWEISRTFASRKSFVLLDEISLGNNFDTDLANEQVY